MKDNPLQRYLSRTFDDVTALGSHDESDGVDDFSAYGMLRGIRDRATMLELRKKDGCILAVSYSFIRSVAFDPNEGITLQLDDHAIRIIGKRLNAELSPRAGLLQGITHHRVLWVSEADRAASINASTQHPIISEIAWG